MTQSDTFQLPPTKYAARLALDFMLRYKMRRGKGNEILSKDIYGAVNKDYPLITRQRLDHWFSGRRNLTDDGFKTIFAFLRSKDFEKLVPEIAFLLDAKNRLVKQGQVLAEIEGTNWEDNDRLFNRISGYWGKIDDTKYQYRNKFSYIEPIEGQPFALYQECTEKGSVEKLIFIDRDEGMPRFENYNENKDYPNNSLMHFFGIDDNGYIENSKFCDLNYGFIFVNKYKNRYLIVTWSKIDRTESARHLFKFMECCDFQKVNSHCFAAWNGDSRIRDIGFVFQIKKEKLSCFSSCSPVHRKSIAIPEKIKYMFLSSK